MIRLSKKKEEGKDGKGLSKSGCDHFIDYSGLWFRAMVHE
jgi:hypothetical protein